MAAKMALTMRLLLLELLQTAEDGGIVGTGIGGAALQAIGHTQPQPLHQPRQAAVAQVGELQIVGKTARQKAPIALIAETAEMRIIPLGGAIMELHRVA